MSAERLPTDAHLWQCVSETLRSVVLPRVEDPWARLALVRLIALAEYAPARGEDPTPERLRQLRSCVDGLADTHLDIRTRLPDAWPTADAHAVLELCGRLLAGAVGDASPAAAAIRAQLRPLLIAQLDDELRVTSRLIPAFQGQLPER